MAQTMPPEVEIIHRTIGYLSRGEIVLLVDKTFPFVSPWYLLSCFLLLFPLLDWTLTTINVYYNEPELHKRQFAFTSSLIFYPGYILVMWVLFHFKSIADEGIFMLAAYALLLSNVIFGIGLVVAIIKSLHRKFVMVPSNLKILVRFSDGDEGMIDPKDFDPDIMVKL